MPASSRPLRRSQPGPSASRAAGIESLTGRELQVARLVVDRKTNPQIAAELFLSQKTVETHLRNIFHKMDVTTRAALARAVERAAKLAQLGLHPCSRRVLAGGEAGQDCVVNALVDH